MRYATLGYASVEDDGGGNVVPHSDALGSVCEDILKPQAEVGS